MSSEFEVPRRPARYRSHCARPRSSVRVAGGTVRSGSDLEITIELPDQVPITEAEARAIELLLGAELREILALPAAKVRPKT